MRSSQQNCSDDLIVWLARCLTKAEIGSFILNDESLVGAVCSVQLNASINVDKRGLVFKGTSCAVFAMDVERYFCCVDDTLSVNNQLRPYLLPGGGIRNAPIVSVTARDVLIC
jgi:hypothetical protein